MKHYTLNVIVHYQTPQSRAGLIVGVNSSCMIVFGWSRTFNPHATRVHLSEVFDTGRQDYHDLSVGGRQWTGCAEFYAVRRLARAVGHCVCF